MRFPNHSSIDKLTKLFSSFINQISVIHSSHSSDSFLGVKNPLDTRNALLFSLLLPSMSCVVLSYLLRASHELDQIPTNLVENCSENLVTLRASIVNRSLSEGSSTLQSAHVSPLLKHPTLNKDNMGNYQSVSSFSYLSNVLQDVVAKRLDLHVNGSRTLDPYQSAYKKFHSTETALLKTHSGIMTSTNNGKVTALTLCLTSTPLITLTILFSCTYLMTGLGYLRRHLTEEKLGSCLSATVSSLSASLKGQLWCHCFYPSIPLHLVVWFLNTKFCIISTLLIASCMCPLNQATQLQHWKFTIMSGLCPVSVADQQLNLNPNKTEFLLIWPEWQRRKYLSMISIKHFNVETNPPPKICSESRNYFDQNCSVHSYICTSHLFDIADIELNKLQWVQNRLAHVVTNSPPFAHSVPLLSFFYCVRVKFRIDFKICFFWPIKHFAKNNSPSLAHQSHSVHWNPTREVFYQFPGLRPTQVQGLFTVALQRCGTTSHYQSARSPLLQLSGNV